MNNSPGVLVVVLVVLVLFFSMSAWFSYNNLLFHVPLLINWSSFQTMSSEVCLLSLVYKKSHKSELKKFNEKKTGHFLTLQSIENEMLYCMSLYNNVCKSIIHLQIKCIYISLDVCIDCIWEYMYYVIWNVKKWKKSKMFYIFLQ